MAIDSKTIFLAIEVETGKAVSTLADVKQGIERLKISNTKLRAEMKKNPKMFKANSAALANNEVKLKKLSSAYREATNAASGLTKEGLRFRDKIAGSLTKSFKTLGKTMLLAFGGMALIRGIGNTIDIIRDFEQAAADVASVLGKTTEETIKLQESAMELGATTRFTATEVQGLQKELAKLGFTEVQIIAAQKAILELAAATGTDLARAAEVAASTVKSFGLTAEDTQEVVDVMAASFSKSILDIERFAEAMKLVAPTARATGRPLQEITAQLGIMADNGISGSIAGTQLNRVFIELNKKGLSLNDAFTKVSGSSNQLAEATDLVGDRGAKALLILSNNTEKLGELEVALDDAGGAAKKMADTQLDTLNGQLDLLNSAWEGFILSLEKGDGVMGKLARGSIGVLTASLTLLTNLSDGASVAWDGITDSNTDAIKAMIRMNDVIGLTDGRMHDLSGVIDKFNEHSLEELEERLGESRNRFVEMSVAQGTNAEEANILFNAYLQVRQETEKSIFAVEKNTGAIEDLVVVTTEEVEVTTDLIKLKKEEIKLAEAMEAPDALSLSIKNEKIILLREELKLLQQLDGFQRIAFDKSADDVLFPSSSKKPSGEVESAADDVGLTFEERKQKQLEQFDEIAGITAQGLGRIQDLTNVATNNKLNALDQELQTELRMVTDQQEQGLINMDEANLKRIKLQESADAKALELRQKQFKKDKAFSIAQITIDTARAVAGALANPPSPPFSIPQAVAAGVFGAAQIAAVAAQKFEKGGILAGASHANGGINLGGGNEAEGGEAIINKNSTALFPELLSAINVAGGGNKFADGGILPAITPLEGGGNSDILNALANIDIRPVVHVSEINSAQNSVRVGEQQASI